MTQIDRLLARITLIGKSHPIVGVFDNLTKSQLNAEERRLHKDNPGKDILVINIVPAKRKRQSRT